MINEIPDSVSAGTEAYLSAWAKSICDVLEKITGIAFNRVFLAPPEVSEHVQPLREKGIWLRFTVEGALKGEQSFGTSPSDALRLAQILMGEPLDATREFSNDYQDALAELFRQFAGAAALALKPRLGGEVTLQLAGYEQASWTPHTQCAIRLTGGGAGQFLLVILVDPGLGQALASHPSARTGAPLASSDQRVPAALAAPSKGKTNIDLLLEVELQVALRFGKREMPLRDILELSAGAVVELDQKILEPVELLVGSKVVAQGEVVVMDGHYALRVTEVLNPLERVESLAA